MKKIKVPVLVGPTASGKTRVAMNCAQRLGLEIVSCDSRQIYKYMDIGTAKPSHSEIVAVKHWLIDIVEPSEPYSAFRFAQDAANIIRRRAGEGKTTIVCGGSGLYFQALSRGLGPHAAADPHIRARYAALAKERGKEAVWERLNVVDSVSAQGSHAENLARNIRALEVFETTGVPLSQLKKQARPPDDLDFYVIVLSLARPALYERIDRRVDDMEKRGLWDEFKTLRAKGYGQQSPGMRCVGYRELFDVENGSVRLQTALDSVKQNARNYAKRQITWLRHQVSGTEVDMSEPQAQVQVNALIEKYLAH